MKRNYFKVSLLTTLFAFTVAINAFAQDSPKGSKYPTLTINGTNASTTFVVDTKGLQADLPIRVIASGGFSVSPATLPANAKNAKVTVTNNSSRNRIQGQIVLRSGDTRSYVHLTGIGTPLTPKDITQSPAYSGGNDDKFVKTASQGFKPAADKGYTVEFKVKTDNDSKEFYPYAVNDKGIGFKAYITSSEIGLYNSSSRKSIPNPITSVGGGLGRFYNDDNRAHTYRFAVTGDSRIFIYRDGLPVDTLRAVDYGTQPDFATENGDPVENLLKNPGFEGEYNTIGNESLVKQIEGWDVAILDRYNSEQYIERQELSNEQDFENHILQLKRYMWSDGWGGAEIVQVVDVAPNETYTLSALARGGIKKDGTLLGKIRIQEAQNNALETSVDVTGSSWETYSMDYTTSASCKQIRVFFYLERDKWGASISALEADNAKLTGKSRTYSSKVGFENRSSNIEYFTYDATGAYAPLVSPEISVIPEDK